MKKTSEKRYIPEIKLESKVINIVHEKIKEALIQKLRTDKFIKFQKNIYEIEETFYPENITNNNNLIDLVAKEKNNTEKDCLIFFEIKTNLDARLCIRQALGQLMEYSYFPNTKHAQKLVVVGNGKRTKDIETYIKNLNKSFNILIDYLQVTID